MTDFTLDAEQLSGEFEVEYSEQAAVIELTH
jgi:hypothetical protein